MKESVSLVNEHDQMYGTMDKLAAHRSGILHRAISVFIFNTAGELLLQQRAFDKYHSGGLWSNTCCSHPRLGEDISDAANRRLDEEMGMKSELIYAFHFIYRADMGNGIIENEYDHVFIGISDCVPFPDPNEAADYRYISLDELEIELQKHPYNYSKWLKICFSHVKEHHLKLFKYGPLAD